MYSNTFCYTVEKIFKNKENKNNIQENYYHWYYHKIKKNYSIN